LFMKKQRGTGGAKKKKCGKGRGKAGEGVRGGVQGVYVKRG
jgi:hypothetical protein